MSVRLLPDTGDPVVLNDPTEGIVNVSVEVGAPSPRDVSFDTAGADGNEDHTTYVGARAVTVAVTLSERPHTRQALIDRLSPHMHPRNRMWLEHTPAPGRAPRRLRVRPDDAPIQWANPATMDLVWTFRTVGRPWWLGESRELDLDPVGPAEGFGFDLEFDLEFPEAVTGVNVATNSGSLDADWVWTVRGPARQPALRNEDTGEKVWLRGLTLLEGQTAVVDSATQTVTVDGAVSYGVLDQATVTWWAIPRGSTPVRMTVAAATGTPDGTLAWSDTYFA